MVLYFSDMALNPAEAMERLKEMGLFMDDSYEEDLNFKERDDVHGG